MAMVMTMAMTMMITIQVARRYDSAGWMIFHISHVTNANGRTTLTVVEHLGEQILLERRVEEVH